MALPTTALRATRSIKGAIAALDSPHKPTLQQQAMPSKASSKAKASLQRIVAQTDSLTPVDFGAALVEWLYRGSPLGLLPFDDQPTIGKTLWTLDALSVSMAIAGTTHFLRGMGSEARLVSDYAQTLGASTTKRYGAEMLRELRSLNGRRLPEETRGAMGSALGRLEKRDEAAGGSGLFETLDSQFAESVVAEIHALLPAYVRDHAGQIVEAYLQHVRPEPAVIPAHSTDGKDQDYFSDDFRKYDERAREWGRRASMLPVSAYEEIARRYRKDAAEKADRKVFKVWTDGPRVGRTQEDWKVEFRLTLKSFVEADARLQQQWAASELSAATRRKADGALEYAFRMLGHLPELERLPGGLALIDTLLAPFEGFIPPWNAEW